MDILAEIEDKLKVKKLERIENSEASGCISKGEAFLTEKGKVFIKFNKHKDALSMFYGELKSLEAIRETRTIETPKPLEIVCDPQSAGGAIVLEYLDLNDATEWTKLGNDLANLHLFNSILGKKKAKLDSWVGKSKHMSKTEHPEAVQALVNEKTKVKIDDELVEELSYIDRFGFEVPTCCGQIEQKNAWHHDWIEFYARQRLEHQINLLTENYGDREVIEYWSELQLGLHKLFVDLPKIEPALLHGDLWHGNVGQVLDTPVIFDPAAFYGHCEYDLAQTILFGGFNAQFFTEYFSKIPKNKGFDTRTDLYKLFHTLNHWNHFGSHKRTTKDIMKTLVRKIKQ